MTPPISLIDKIKLGADNGLGVHLYPNECEIVLKLMLKDKDRESPTKREKRG